MPKPKKQFSPHIYAEWGEIFDYLKPEENSEILIAISKFPNYEPKVNIPIWNFIKSQLQKDYEIFLDKCEKNSEISRNYWKNKYTNDTESNRTDTERYPKRITNNELQITDNTEKPNEEKIKPLDFGASKEVSDFFRLINEYTDSQYNDLPPNRMLVARMLPRTTLNMDIWKQVIIKSKNCGHKINGEFKPLSLKNMLEHYSEILDGTYGLVNKWE